MSKRLVLIDGSSYLYRAYHVFAARGQVFTAPDGMPTTALFGVHNMLRAHLKEAPDAIAFVMDAAGKTFRDDIDPEYKANRPPMPDDLRAQVEPLMEIVAALGLPILREEGVEADDVIGTLALQAAADGVEVTVSTGDKDMAQLVRPGVALVNTMSGSRLDSDAAVIEKFGVGPAHIIDYLALVGDSVDNIPGVDKCGPKTAAKWLAEYGSLDGIIANADAIKGKVGDNLRAVLQRLPLNRQLATIRTDVPLQVGHADLALRPRDVDALRALYTRYGFNQALKELDGVTEAPLMATGAALGSGKAPGGLRGFVAAPASAAAVDPALGQPGRYECVATQAQLDAWARKLGEAQAFAFDTETDSLDPMQAELVGVSLCVEAGSACYIPLAHDVGAGTQLPRDIVLAALAPFFADTSKRKIAQNGKFDLHVLARHGVPAVAPFEDTLLQSFVLDSTQRHDMDTQAKRLLGMDTVKYEDVAGKGAKQIRFNQVSLEDATRYAAEDADVARRLESVLSPKLAAEPALDRVYREIELPLLPVLARVEANGVLIDAAELRTQSADLSRRMLEAQQQATALAGRAINLDSPKQLGALLYDELKLPALVKTPGGAPSTNEEALEAIAELHALPRAILEYRGLAKLRSTYTDKLPEMINPATGRVHTNYHQAGAATGRLSSSDPNLQNIPIRTEEGRRIRRAFVAPEGRRILACDYSQIELRIMAHLSEDPALLRAFDSGDDVHRATAGEVFGKPIAEVSANERRAAKAINFGLMYGMSAFGLAKQLGIARGEAQDYIGLYFSRYPGVRDYMERTRAQAREQGYVETVFGRRLYLPYIDSRNQAQRAGAERAAINAPMQGTAADIIKRAMVRVDEWLAGQGSRARMIMQVHDELVFECDADFIGPLREAVQERMAAAADLRVPLLVDAGDGSNWDEAH